MEFKYVMTPAGMGKKIDMDAAVKACRYFRMEDVPVSPVLAFSFLEGEEWLMNWLSKALLSKSGKVVVCADEVTEQMMRLIRLQRNCRVRAAWRPA